MSASSEDGPEACAEDMRSALLRRDAPAAKRAALRLILDHGMDAEALCFSSHSVPAGRRLRAAARAAVSEQGMALGFTAHEAAHLSRRAGAADRLAAFLSCGDLAKLFGAIDAFSRLPRPTAYHPRPEFGGRGGSIRTYPILVPGLPPR